MKGKLITLTVLMIIGSNISSIFAYGGAKNTNLSGGMLLFFCAFDVRNCVSCK